MENKYIQLIHNDLDGLITPSERQELSKAMQNDPELRKLYEQFHHLSDQLNQITQTEPPPTLKKQIIESIDFNQYQENQADQDWRVHISQWFAEPRLRLAYGLAAGIILGILFSLYILPGLINQPALQIKDLYGTIGIHESDLNVLKELSVTDSSFQGTFKVKSYWNIVGFEIDFKTATETEIQLGYNKDFLVFRGITTLKSTRTALESSDNLITLTSAQDGDFLILFEKLSPPVFPVNLKIVQDGELILKETLTEE